MQYNFDEIIPRRGTYSVKWDSMENDGILPMWVADMDFHAAPVIIEAVQRRVAHGVFGYTRVPDEYYEAVTNWFARRHQWQIQRDWIIYTSGVVPALSAIIKALTEPGDKVLIQPPVYNCFFSSTRNNGCETATNPLIRTGNTFTVNYDELEEKASDPKVKVMLLCNPHNPAGRVWTREELVRMGEICIRNGVTIVADEIHCELVMPGYTYTPFASLSEEFQRHSVTCVSPSKAFNIAGLQIANIVCSDAGIRAKIDRAININEICDVNPFGVAGAIAAYNEGEDWLLQLLDYLKQNYLHMQAFCSEHLPQFPICKVEGTYLVWMDCRALQMSSEALERQLVREAKLRLNAGTMYGAEGEGFMRWNIACPKSALTEGLKRFEDFVTRNAAKPAL